MLKLASTYRALESERDALSLDLAVARDESLGLRRKNQALRNRVTWLQLQMGLHGLEVVETPEQVVPAKAARTVPARSEVRRARKA